MRKNELSISIAPYTQPLLSRPECGNAGVPVPCTLVLGLRCNCLYLKYQNCSSSEAERHRADIYAVQLAVVPL
jgi:hypothetical protein